MPVMAADSPTSAALTGISGDNRRIATGAPDHNVRHAEETKAFAMTLRRLRLPLLALTLLLLPNAAAAQWLQITYAVSVRGFPVGTAKIAAEMQGERFSLSFSGGMSGLARLFSDARTTVTASGRVTADRLQPEEYSHVWTEGDDTETVAMRFAGRGVTDVTLNPPLDRPERFVPVTAAHKADALDVASAIVWPAPGGLNRDVCARTLPLFDGKRRFDIALSFKRKEAFSARSFAKAAMVCAIRYVPISGHKPKKETGAFVAGSRDAEVWVASVAPGYVAPVLIQLPTRIGRIVLKATRVRGG